MTVPIKPGTARRLGLRHPEPPPGPMSQPQVRAAVAQQVGEQLPDGTFRQWKSRGQIVPVGQDADGKLLYDLDDALRLMHRRMRRKEPKPPPAPPKPCRGADNARWKGDAVGYHAVHYRLRRMIGRPNECTCCGTREVGRRYEWALNWEGTPTVQDGPHGQYSTNLDDYVRMCKPCHKRMDIQHARDVGFRRGS